VKSAMYRQGAGATGSSIGRLRALLTAVRVAGQAGLVCHHDRITPRCLLCAVALARMACDADPLLAEAPKANAGAEDVPASVRDAFIKLARELVDQSRQMLMVPDGCYEYTDPQIDRELADALCGAWRMGRASTPSAPKGDHE
jgi:hypothetical protein